MNTGFGAAMRYPFLGENKWKNLLFGMICFFIPIVGPIVFMGYGVVAQRRLIENLAAEAPTFDFGKFGEYLKLGVSGFVAALLAGLVAGVLVVPLMLVFMLLGAVAGKSDALMMTLVIVGVVAYVGFILLMNVVLIPVIMRAELEQSITAGFRLGYVVGFLKRVGLLTAWYILCFFGLGILGMFGLCLFIVGIYLAMAYLLMAQFHMKAQLYLAYVQRGGEPFAIAADGGPQGFQPVLQQP